MLHFKHSIDSGTHEEYLEIPLQGKPLLSTPQLNKGTAFTEHERLVFGLMGKLPSRVESLEEQATRSYEQYLAFSDPVNRSIYLHNLHNINQVLFYYLVSQHLQEMLPIIYTPTVGISVQNFSREYRRARGLYITYSEQEHMDSILDNRTNPDIELIVVTDGEGVLGIGDQGIGAIDISIAKLMVYTLCAGIEHIHTLPIQLDVGTNNPTLLSDPFYLGLRQKRIEGPQYDAFVDRFVQTIKKKFPNALLHWEDFGRQNGWRLLEKYKNQLCTFNDDIQGTGAVALATVLAAIKHKKESLLDQKIVIFGAGSAGTGIADQIREAMIREGASFEEATRCFWLLDRQGLIHQTRSDFEELIPALKTYARSQVDMQNWMRDPSSAYIGLADVINNLRTTILIGCSAQSGAFTENIVRSMASKVEKPIILALSNPTNKIEALPEDLIAWTNGSVLIATGSPFPPVKFNGIEKVISQCNNALIFPGLGLGMIAVKAKHCTDNLLWAACDALSDFSPINTDSNAPLLPGINQAREVAYAVALRVAQQAHRDGLSQISLAEEDLPQLIAKKMWIPRYLPYHPVKEV